MKTILLAAVTLSAILPLSSQQLVSPIVNFTQFNSPFGPRNKGTTELMGTYYDYDFHPAMDLRAGIGSSVLSIAYGGPIGPERYVQGSTDNWVDMGYNLADLGVFDVRFMHVDRSQLWLDRLNYRPHFVLPIDAGEVIGSVGPANHLDIRYYPGGIIQSDVLDLNADNPGRILQGIADFVQHLPTGRPYLKDANGNALVRGTTIPISYDGSAFAGNPQWAPFFEFKVGNPRRTLPITAVYVVLSGTDENNHVFGNFALLQGGDPPESVEANYSGWVDYYNQDIHEFSGQFWRAACGDRWEDGDDGGHVSSSIAIIPTMLPVNVANLDDPSADQITRFRIYINPTLWPRMVNGLTVRIGVRTWYGTTSIWSSPRFVDAELSHYRELLFICHG